MVSLVTDNFRINNAKALVESIGNNNYYFYLGGFSPWDDDNVPPTPSDNITEVQLTQWDTMFGMKKVGLADVTLLVPRIDWTSGTVYTAYDPTVNELSRTNHYVLVNDSGTYKVYKCIENNSGTQSTTQPTATSATIFTTADGYKWKYMYTVTTSDAIRFITPTFMPVSPTVGTSNIDNTETGLLPLPPNGHGADNITELGAYYVGFNVRFEYDENGTISTENDFRIRGLLVDPTLFGSTTLATGSVYRQSTELTLTGASGTFQNDEVIEGTSPTDLAKVIEYDATNSKLFVKVTSGTIANTDTVTGQTSNATATVSSINTEEIEPYSGNVIYIENRKPTARAIDQIESQTLILEL